MSYHHLTLNERKKLSLLWREKESIRQIAKVLKRSPSTICRELKRNISHDRDRLVYRPVSANRKYQRRKRQERKGKYQNVRLCEYVQEKLLLTWSPEQVSNRVRQDYPAEPLMRISHTTIYRWLHKERFAQSASIHLRHEGRQHGERRGKLLGIRTLKQRGREIWRRERIGDWELDTIISSSKESQAGILTMCDRKSRFCILVLLERCHSQSHVFRVLSSVVSSFPCHSFTADQGTEFRCYAKVENELGLPMYFCSPSSPWQKGSVENLNGLVREFFPKGTNFVDVSSKQVAHAMFLLNNRPRKCLNWLTPPEAIAAASF